MCSCVRRNTWGHTLASKKPDGGASASSASAALDADGKPKKATRKRKSVGFDVAVELKVRESVFACGSSFFLGWRRWW